MRDSASPSIPSSRKYSPWLLIAALLVGAVAYLGAILRGIEVWSSSPDEQHGFLVLPLAVFLLYLRRDTLPRDALAIDLRGLCLIALAGGMRVYSELYVRPWMDLWSLPIWVGGVVWLFGGWKLFRWSAPAIAFLFFMAPLPGQVQTLAGYPLQRVAATGGGWLLQVLGQPAFVSGTTILLGENILDIERACAGLRMFHGMLAVAVAWSLYSRYRWPRFLALLAIAPLVAVFVNVLRIGFTGLLFQYVSGDAARTFTHDWAGLVMIPTGAVIFFVIDSLAERMIAANRETPDRWLKYASGAIAVAFALGIGGYYVHKTQQRKAIGLVLEEARRLIDTDETANIQQGVRLMQQYLTVRSDDAAVLAELGDVSLSLGPTEALRAARLYELAWTRDPTRTDDAIKSVDILASRAAYNDLWELCNRLLPDLSGDVRTTVLRYRTDALAQMEQFSLASVDASIRFEAAMEAQDEDPDYFPHTLRMADILRQNEEVMSDEAISAWLLSHSQQGEQNYPLDAETTDREATWRELLDSGDRKALQLIDALVASHPDAAEPLLYRTALLSQIQIPSASADARGRLESSGNDALDRAMDIVERMGVSAAGSDASSEDPSTQRLRRVAGSAYLAAGQRALVAGDETSARDLLEKSAALMPGNFRVYLLLADLIPRDDYRRRIALFRKGVEETEFRELTLLLPLAEAYLASGREADAEELLAPLREQLPGISQPARGQIKLMLASSRASALTQQGKLDEAVSVLEDASQSPDVQSAGASIQELYARSLFQLGTLYRRLNRESAAAAAFREGSQYDQDSPVRRLSEAMEYEATGNRLAALREYREAARVIGRQQPDIYLAIARNLLAVLDEQTASAGQLDAARQLIRNAENSGADPTLASSLMAESYLLEGKVQLALDVLDQQIAKYPSLPGLIFAKALLLQEVVNDAAAFGLLDPYTAAGASPGERLLLEVLIHLRGERLEDAVAALRAAESSLSDAELKAARTQIAVANLAGDILEQRVQRLEQLAERYPDDRDVQRLAGMLLSALRQYDAAERAEDNLRRLEGDNGTAWRLMRAERLLLSGTTQSELDEATGLVDELQQLLPMSSRTLQLQGILASRQGNWREAVRLFQSSWDAGQRDAAIAVQLITALNRIGEGSRANALIDEVVPLLPTSTALFERALPRLAQRPGRESVVEIARQWVEAEPTPDNQLRLAQTLVTVAVAGGNSDPNREISDEQRALLDEAEGYINAVIEETPDDLTAWITYFQLIADGRGDRQSALTQLEQLANATDIPELDRSFVLAQLYASIDEGAKAGRLFEQCLSQVDQRSAAEAAGVKSAAARFFADRRPERAIEVLREVVTSGAAIALEAEQQLIALLVEQATVPALDEALSLHNLPEPVSPQSDTLAKRIQVELLLARESAQEDTDTADSAPRAGGLQPVGSNSSLNDSQRLRQAEELIDSISSLEAGDYLLLARIYDRQGKPFDAFQAYRRCLQLEVSTPSRLIEFGTFWNRNFAVKNQYSAIADGYLADLAALAGQAGAWLRLRLERARIQNASAVAEENSETPEVPPPSDQELLKQYRDRFLTVDAGDVFIEAVFQNLVGLGQANRSDLVAPALDALEAEAKNADELFIAASLAAVQASETPSLGTTIVDWLIGNAADRQALSLDATRLIADACYVNGYFDNAVALYRRAIMLEPDNSNHRNSLALVMAEAGPAVDDSLEILDELIAQEPENLALYDSKLMVAILGERLDIAQAIGAQLTDDMTGYTLLHRAYLAELLGNSTDAVRLFEMARDAQVAENIYSPSDRRILTELSAKFIDS